MTLSSGQWVQLLSSIGGAGVLAFNVVGFIRGWIVPGYLYRREHAEKRDLLDATLKNSEAAKLALDIAKQRERDAQDERA